MWVRSAHENTHYAYSSIFYDSKVPMLIISPETGGIVDANPAAIQFYGYSKADLTSKRISQINQLSQDEVAEEMRRAKAMKRNHFIFKHQLSSGCTRDVEVYSSPIRVANEHYLFSVIHDITNRIEAENQLKIYAKLFTSSNDMLAVVDTNLNYLAANGHYLHMLGRTSDEVIGRNLYDVLGPESFHFSEPYIQEALKGAPVLFERKNTAQTDISHLEVRYFPFTGVDGKYAGVVGVFRDVSDIRKAAEHMSYLAHHDVLTGLANRLELEGQLRQYIERARRFNSLVYVLFVDLDRFKNINDTMGHATGDALLCEVASRLKACIRSTDTVSRVSGDEFVVVVEVSERGGQITRTLDRIREVFATPFEVDHGLLHVTASIGVSQYPDDADESVQLISNADTAMYRAKQTGRNQVAFFSKEEAETLLLRSRIETALRGVLERNELELYFQPQISIGDHSLKGFEVLLRWTHPELGAVSPAVFVPVAEQNGLMCVLGAWVIRSACAQASAWHRRGIQFGRIAINVSVVQLRKPDFSDEVVSILGETGLPPECLELEITESFMMTQAEDALQQLRRLRALGVMVAVDDFGTGYSSLSYLTKLPLDWMKIDRSFVADIENDEDSKALVLSIIALAKAMQLNVIAEGVETAGQEAVLSDNGCGFAQGYFYNRPMPVAEVEALLCKVSSMGRA